jgi:glycosyltransferase involved in cell wall biosynthesis
MNILYVSQWLSAVGGGGEVVFRDFAYGMTRFSHNVDVISQNHSDIVDEPTKENLNINRIGTILHGPPPPSLRQNISFMISGIVQGARIIISKKVDIIHANNMSSAIIGATLAKLFSLPLVITIHSVYGKNDFWKQWGSQPNVSRISSFIAPLAEKVTIRVKSDAIHTVTHSTKNDIIEFGAKSMVFVVHNGLKLDDWDGLNLKIEYHDYVLFIGRLVVNKNLGLLINAFREVVNSLPRAKLVIVGDGPMRREWEKLSASLDLQSNVDFLGFVSEKVKAELLSKCSALILPSDMEALTLTVLEAFVMHKTVIVPNLSSAHEVVDDGFDGFICPLNSESDWAKKILLLLTDTSLARIMGEHARTKVKDRFNQERVLEEINSLYINVLRNHNQYHQVESKVWRTLSMSFASIGP